MDTLEAVPLVAACDAVECDADAFFAHGYAGYDRKALMTRDIHEYGTNIALMSAMAPSLRKRLRDADTDARTVVVGESDSLDLALRKGGPGKGVATSDPAALQREADDREIARWEPYFLQLTLGGGGDSTLCSEAFRLHYEHRLADRNKHLIGAAGFDQRVFRAYNKAWAALKMRTKRWELNTEPIVRETQESLAARLRVLPAALLQLHVEAGACSNPPLTAALDQVAIERAGELAKLPQRARNVSSSLDPDIGPNKETLATHDRHYVNMESGAGKGQTRTVAVWTKKQRVE